MKEGFRKIGMWGLMCLVCVMLWPSCQRRLSQEDRVRVDSLNRVAYEVRYKDLSLSSRAATEALRLSDGYASGRAEALNNMGFCAFMRMDFEHAARLFQKASEASKNEIERLVADVGMMKICQRTSRNKEFYDYHNSAMQRLRRINEDRSSLEENGLEGRLNYALSEFYIVSGIYYYYLQQDKESMQAINAVPEEALKGDTAQWLYYVYMRGSGGMYEAPTREEVTLGEFGYLVQCLQVAQARGYIYFEANALQAMAELLVFRSNRELLSEKRAGLLRLVNPESLPVDSLPLVFAKEALGLFKRYGDWYQISGTYRTLATFYNYTGQPEKALVNLKKALNYVNLHHEKYYHCTDTLDRLQAYQPGGTTSIELQWINDEGINTVPEWIARLREQLSRTYSAMGCKAESDYNRNVYLDILDYTRQDKELESRYTALEKETRQLNVLLWLVAAGCLVLVVLFVWLNRSWREKNTVYLAELKRVLGLCQQITGAVPASATRREEVAEAVAEVMKPELKALFGVCDVCITFCEEGEAEEVPCHQGEGTPQVFELQAPGKSVTVGKLWMWLDAPVRKEEQALIRLLLPYLAWTLEHGLNLVSLDEEQKRLEKEQYLHELHLMENKRQNEVKKACLSIVTGIVPYIDRMVNEVRKLRSLPSGGDETLRKGKLVYIDELVTKINEYNDILALWIKMRQGTLSLHIENFDLEELFAIIAKGRRSFELKKQTLTVGDTTACVKADKALTLFMINTLVENARKYTQEGGRVSLSAEETSDYVEIAVEDNGPGLSEKDRSRILGEKVYDSGAIGMETATDAAELQRQKGHGFGLMNCKGIIEKYRKTNSVFAVCRFDIQSTLGKGSRFSFRLPKGARRMVGLLWLGFCLLVGVACSSKQQPVQPVPDSGKVAPYDSLLAIANDYANWVYECNVHGEHAAALVLADSVLYYMNAHYLRYSGKNGPLLRLEGEGDGAELAWLAESFDTDYFILLDVRNEAAVAALAVKDFRKYRYNNAAYASLYKRLSKDNSLEEYCLQMQRSASNKRIALSLFVLLVCGCLIAYYALYLRHRLHYRYNMEQVFVVNRTLFSAASGTEALGDEALEKMVRCMFNELNEILLLENMALAVYDEETCRLKTVCFAAEDGEEELHERLQRCYDSGQMQWTGATKWSFLPLWVETGGEKHCVGVLALKLARAYSREEDRLLVEMVCNYLAVMLYNVVVRVNRKFHDIELAQDEARRSLFEENQLHVQNMVLDNCLSTIKHETIYYPSRIKQVADRLSGDVTEAQRKELLENMAELVGYYKDIFTLLSSCASRQLEEVTFRRTEVSMEELAEGAGKYLKKTMRKRNFTLEWQAEIPPLWVTGDRVLLLFLLENLIDEAVRYEASGTLRLEAKEEDGFVRVDFIDTRRSYPQEVLNALFYPDKKRMCPSGDGSHLSGTEYLVCKQIIRDHDEYGGRRGCRINACAWNEGKGFSVWFTLPKRNKK